LLEALKSLSTQTFRDFEVCVSDDCSTDGREREIIGFLEKSGLKFTYRRMDKNSRYDANLRSAIAMARGEYCFLLGNDDCLKSPETLQALHGDMNRFTRASVVITNFERFDSGKAVRRIRRTGLAGSGPAAAALNFRNFSFISGVVLEAKAAHRHETDRWDGSEMYQMYIGSRIIAEGGPLLNLERVLTREGIKIPGEQVDAYFLNPKIYPCPVVERSIPLNQTGKLVADAIKPYLRTRGDLKWNKKIFMQLYLFTLPFWLVEYRRVQSWNYSLGVCLGMRPKRSLEGVRLTAIQRLMLKAVYGIMSAGGLLVPITLFARLKGIFNHLARTTYQAR